MIATRRTVKEYLNITTDTNNARIDQFIPVVEKHYLAIRNRDWDYDSNDDIEYPDLAEFTAAQMVGFLLKSTDFSTSGTYNNLKSENIGDYGYTRTETKDNVYGYPKWIIDSIDRFPGLK
ncbi:MAG: hypothetical protein JSW06_02700 [Thermoplasmatales archaeon]|nr:MAG: hypothetical protein JSW06_02700 [Thermoplasmatales archaeon]